MVNYGKRNGSSAARSPGLGPIAPDAGPDERPKGAQDPLLADPEGAEMNPPASERRTAWNQRATDEQIVAAYRITGSVWKAAKRLGLAGQSVHERLRRLGYPMAHQEWSEEELKEAISLADETSYP